MLLSGFAAAGLGGAAPAPRLMCEEPEFHFGERFADDPPISHTFILRNVGTTSLTIREIENRCGCTGIALSTHTVAPGSTAELRAALSLRRRPGPVRETLVVHSDDPTRPRLELAFVGVIRPDVRIEPGAALLGKVPSDRPSETILRVHFPPERPDRVVRAEVSADWFEALVEEQEADRAYLIRIRTVPPLSVADTRLRGVVRLKTQRGRGDDPEIPVVGWIADPVFVMPAALPIPRESDRPLRRYLLIRPGSAREVQTEQVEMSGGEARISVHPLEHGGWQVQLDGLVPARLPPEAVVLLRLRVDGRLEEKRIPFVRE